LVVLDNPLYRNLDFILGIVHQQVSRGARNRYQISPHTLVLYDGGKVVELYHKAKGVKVYEGEKKVLSKLDPDPKWPSFSIVNVQNRFMAMFAQILSLQSNINPLRVLDLTLDNAMTDIYGD
jgi:hypothetical protein